MSEPTLMDKDMYSSMQILLDKKLDVFFWPASRSGAMSAWWGHVPFAHWVVAATRPKVIVELGTHNGASFAAFCESVQRSNVVAKCFAVDTWQGDEHAGIYGEEIYTDLKHFIAARYSAFADLVRSTFDEAQPYFADGSIDLLHIDGLHTYEAVKHDFETWLPKISECGIVIFHDINVRERDFGVWRLWQELRKNYDGFEFSHAHGLGVLLVGQKPPAALTQLLLDSAKDSKYLTTLQSRLSELGRVMIEADMARRYANHAAQLEKTNAHLNDSVSERQKIIDELQRNIADKTQAHLSGSNQQVSDALERLQKTEQSLIQLKAQLDASNQHVIALQQSADKACQSLNDGKERSVELARLLGITDDHLHDLWNLQFNEKSDAWKEWVKDREAALQHQCSSIKLIAKQLKCANALNQELANRIKVSEISHKSFVDDIHRSVSWRLTAPVRFLKLRRLLRRFSGVVSSPPLEAMASDERCSIKNKEIVSSPSVMAEDDIDALVNILCPSFHEPSSNLPSKSLGVSMVEASGLFDVNFYKGTKYALQTGQSPIDHYLTIGESKGWGPSVKFDPLYYKRRYEDLAFLESGELLLHYIRFGRAEGRVAYSLFGQETVPVGEVNSQKGLAIAASEGLQHEYNKKTEELEKKLAIQAAKISEIYASNSWKVTAPVRWLSTKVRQGRKAITLFGVMRKRHEGTLNVLSHGIGMVRQVGIAGMVEAAGSLKVPEDYSEWVRRYDTIDIAIYRKLSGLVERFSNKPLISILMPVYNPRLDWLEKAIASVQAQIYTNWELCIADDASPNAACREKLELLAAEDKRIKIVYRSQNGHISAASNSALELVEGEWTALMDQDDLLPADALVWIAHAINSHLDLRLIYSDEDKVDDDDRRFDPYFKSDWNRDLFLSQNMFSHLGVYRTDLLHEVGGFRQGLEGAQDYDLVLRCIERLRSDQIHHVPKVLYHWRVHADSTASSTDAKPYAQIAGTRALNEHFQRTGIKGHVEPLEHGYRARYDLPDPAPLVSLIIPTRNAASLVRQCVDSIVALTTYLNYEIIIVDNGSDDPDAVAYFNELSLRPRFKLIRDEGEFNYSALNNEAVAQSSGQIIGLINNDIEVISPEWLSEMVSIAVQPGVGAVGARLWYPDETLQHGGVVLGIGGVANHSHKHLPRGRKGYFGRADLIQSFSAVTAACLIVNRTHYERVGGLDAVHLKVAFNDVDFCLRLREAGLRNVWTPYAELFHHESATRGEDVHPEKRRRFVTEVDYMIRRWGEVLERDPAYNPNLTSKHEDFSLAWPPKDSWKSQ